MKTLLNETNPPKVFSKVTFPIFIPFYLQPRPVPTLVTYPYEGRANVC